MSAQRYAALSLILIGALILVACGRGQAEPTAAPTAEPMPATSPPPTMAAAPPSPTAGQAEPTQESQQEEIQGEEVRFEWQRQLSTIEELEPILLLVEDFDGVAAASGSEVHIDITYNPDVTSVEELQDQLRQIGQPVKDPEDS